MLRTSISGEKKVKCVLAVPSQGDLKFIKDFIEERKSKTCN